MPPAAKRLPQPLVDFHVHLFPDRLFDAIRRQFVTDYGWSVLHPLYWRESVAYLRERASAPSFIPITPTAGTSPEGSTTGT